MSSTMSDLVPFVNETLKDEEILSMKKIFDSFTKKLYHSREMKLVSENGLVLCHWNMELVEKIQNVDNDHVILFQSKNDMKVITNIHPKEIKNFQLIIGGVQVGASMNLRLSTNPDFVPQTVDNNGYGFAALDDYDSRVTVVIRVGPFSKSEDFDAFLSGDTNWAAGSVPSLEDANNENQEERKIAIVEKNIMLSCILFIFRNSQSLERYDVGSVTSKLDINTDLSKPVSTKALTSTKCPPSILLNAAASIRDMVKHGLKLEIKDLENALVASRTVTVTFASSLETIVGQAQFVFEKNLGYKKHDPFFEVAFPKPPTLSFATIPKVLWKVSIGGIDTMTFAETAFTTVCSCAFERCIGEDGWISINSECAYRGLRLTMKVRALNKDKINAPSPQSTPQIHEETQMTFQMFLEKLGLMEDNKANFELVVETIQFRTQRFLELFEFMEAEDDDVLHQKDNDLTSKKDDTVVM